MYDPTDGDILKIFKGRKKHLTVTEILQAAGQDPALMHNKSCVIRICTKYEDHGTLEEVKVKGDFAWKLKAKDGK